MSSVSATFAAIIAAGGSGTRFSSANQEAEKPKQFLQLRGLPLYAWSLIKLAKHKCISQVVIAAPKNLLDTIQTESSELSKKFNLTAKITAIAGGKTRQESVFKSMKYLESGANPPDYVLIHDAARPFLNEETIDVMIAGVIKYGACTVGGEVSDTIKRVSDGKIIETIPREELAAVQTPQGGEFKNLMQAHQEAALAGFASTDDAALFEWAGIDVYVVDGPQYNLKVTKPLDLVLAESLADYLLKDHL